MMTPVLGGLRPQAHGADIRFPFLLGTSVRVCGERISQKCAVFSVCYVLWALALLLNALIPPHAYLMP